MVNVRQELEAAANQFRGLVGLSKQNGIQTGYHNHEEYIGAPVWDMASVIETLDPKWDGLLGTVHWERVWWTGSIL